MARRPGLIPPTQSFQRLIPVDAGALFSRRGERERKLKRSSCPAGLMREHRHLDLQRETPTELTGCLGTTLTPAEPGGCSHHSPLPGRSRGAGHRRPPELPAPCPPPSPRPRRRPLSSPCGGLGVAIQARAQPAAAGEAAGKGWEAAAPAPRRFPACADKRGRAGPVPPLRRRVRRDSVAEGAEQRVPGWSRLSRWNPRHFLLRK